MSRSTPAFSTTKPTGTWPFKRVVDADDRAFGHVGMVRQHLFHVAGGEPVAGDVDDVVGAGHHEDIAVLVDVAGVAGLIVAGILGEVGFR